MRQILQRLDQNQVGAAGAGFVKIISDNAATGLEDAFSESLMDADSQDFSEELTSCPRSGFKTKFGRTARRLGLSNGLDRHELACLYEATFLAALCNISFNGLGGCGGEVRPEKEPTRCRLEQAFMAACHNFYACPGWKALKRPQKKSIQSVFLSVFVNEENLAL